MNKKFDTYTQSILSLSQRETLTSIISTHATNIMPTLPKGIEAVIPQLSGIKAVVFDIYGTVVCSAAGEIHTNISTNHAVFEVPELSISIAMPIVQDHITEYVQKSHTIFKAQGIQYPEIDAIEMWQHIILSIQGNAIKHYDAALCAVYYEIYNNPTALMPYALKSLEAIQHAGYKLGIVSNAQFYTPLMLDALCNSANKAVYEALRFDIQVWSYLQREGKPSTRLYELMLEQCAKYDISAHEVLYIGNDKRNDVYPASVLGIHTLLFAGDRISYKPRLEDKKVSAIIPDGVITCLSQILEVLDIT